MANGCRERGIFYRIFTVLLVVCVFCMAVPSVAYASEKESNGHAENAVYAQQTHTDNNVKGSAVTLDSRENHTVNANRYDICTLSEQDIQNTDNKETSANVVKTSSETQMTTSTQITWFVLLLVLVSAAVGVIVFERKRQKNQIKRNNR